MLVHAETEVYCTLCELLYEAYIGSLFQSFWPTGSCLPLSCMHFTWKPQWRRMALALSHCFCLLQYPLVSAAVGLFCTWQLRAGRCCVQRNWMMWYCFLSSWCQQSFLGSHLSSPSSKPLGEMIAHIAKMKAFCLSKGSCWKENTANNDGLVRDLLLFLLWYIRWCSITILLATSKLPGLQSPPMWPFLKCLVCVCLLHDAGQAYTAVLLVLSWFSHHYCCIQCLSKVFQLGPFTVK